MRFPTIKELTAEVEAYSRDLAAYDEADLMDGDGEVYGEIRLQVTDSGWSVQTGDPSYDLDHRGFWGASSIEPDASYAQCREIAKGLIEEARDAYATR